MKDEEEKNSSILSAEKETNATVSADRSARAARRFREIVQWFMLRTDLRSRWPCPYCGRENPDAPLCQVECKFENGGYAVLGCWLCNTEDVRDEARDALRQFPKKEQLNVVG